MSGRHLFICLYIWLEKSFSAGDYRRPQRTIDETPTHPTVTPPQLTTNVALHLAR